jgi:dTDP-glucose 4,6-dehydratase
MDRHPIVAEDCARALPLTIGLWDAVRDQRVFLTGGTGFFGCWFLELLTYAADHLGFSCEIVVLTRDPASFCAGPARHLARHRCVQLLAGDVRTFTFPSGPFPFVAHFGSTGTRHFLETDPAGFYDLIVQGTRRVLDFAATAATRRLLLASSGIVYGSVFGENDGRLQETYSGGPSPTSSAAANAEGKRAAEFFALAAARQNPRLAVAIARGFAFIGPYLPPGANFAAYDFLRDALAGRAIKVSGDGSPLRSYLYAADLAIWLWTLLLHAPASSIWNVGSPETVSIRQLAERIAAIADVGVEIAAQPTPGAPPHLYVPSVEKARRELGLAVTTDLYTAIHRTLAWLRSRS